jgi:hypothetical protein
MYREKHGSVRSCSQGQDPRRAVSLLGPLKAPLEAVSKKIHGFYSIFIRTILTIYKFYPDIGLGFGINSIQTQLWHPRIKIFCPE